MAQRHVFIGSGPAAMAAAEAIRSVDESASLTIVSADPHGYYSRPGLAYYLANEVPEKVLFPFGPADAKRLNAETVLGRAVSLDPAGHTVRLADGRELAYDRLLLATGSSAIPVRVPGAELDGVVSLDHMDDAREIIRRGRAAKTAVVVGGGITALEIVEGLQARRVRVHYLMRKDRYWGNVLSEAESRLVERGLADQGVQIHYFSELTRIVGRNGRVTAVETSDGATIPCDIVGTAIGVAPQRSVAETSGIACGRGVLVDEYLRTSAEDVFAAGDIAEVTEGATGRRTIEVLWSSAVAKGRVAGTNMATGSTLVYSSVVPLNITRLAGVKTTIIGTVGSGEGPDLEGLARGDSQRWSELGPARIAESDAGGTHIRLALGEREIAGAVVMGDQAVSFPLQEIIESHVDITAIAEKLLAPGAPVADILTRFHQDRAGLDA